MNRNIHDSMQDEAREQMPPSADLSCDIWVMRCNVTCGSCDATTGQQNHTLLLLGEFFREVSPSDNFREDTREGIREGCLLAALDMELRREAEGTGTLLPDARAAFLAGFNFNAWVSWFTSKASSSVRGGKWETEKL